MGHHALPDDGAPRDHVILFFQDFAVREHGDEVMGMAHFALEACPELGWCDGGGAPGRVHGRGEGDVDFGWHYGV